MLLYSTIGDIMLPSTSVSGDPDPIFFIQCVNGREPIAHELWCHGLEGLCREVHTEALVETPTGNV